MEDGLVKGGKKARIAKASGFRKKKTQSKSEYEDYDRCSVNLSGNDLRDSFAKTKSG